MLRAAWAKLATDCGTPPPAPAELFGAIFVVAEVEDPLAVG
jgi:hypothetical protein